MNNYFDNLNKVPYVYKKNQIIKSEGDVCDYIYYILEGEVKAYTYTSEENVYLINTIKENDIFGDIPLFSSNNIFLGNVIASKATKLILISKSEFLDLCKNENFLALYLKHNNDKFLNLQNRLKVLSQKNIREKVLFYLNKKSFALQSNIIPIESKEKLAEYLNIPRPSLSRELIKLKNDGLIDFDRHHIILSK